MPRKALRCCVELDVHTVTCPGVYLPHRNDVYLSITLFRGQYRRTQLMSPSFPLMFHEKFRFDKLFYTAYQPQQVADALENDHIRIELVQLSDVRECGRLLAYFECNAKDFLYPYPQYAVSYGSCADRQILMERTLEFPGIAPKLEFSTKTTLTEVDHALVASAVVDSGLMSDSYLSYRPRSSRSPVRRRSLSRHRSTSRKAKSKTQKRSKSPCSSYHHRRPTISSISHYRSTSPCLRSLNASLRDFSLYESRDDDDKPPFVVRKVESGLIGRVPGTKHPRPHSLRCSRGSRSRSKSPSKYTTGGGYLDDDYRLVGRKYTHRHKVVREPATDYSSYSDDEYDEVLSDVSDPGPFTPRARARSATRSAVYRRTRSPSPILARQSLRDRFEDNALTTMIERKVDDAIRKNRSFERLDRPSSRGSRHDEDFKRIKDMERDLEISRNRSFVHMNDGEYWTQKAAEYKGKSHRDVFNEGLQKVYSDMYTKSKKSTKFDDRVY